MYNPYFKIVAQGFNEELQREQIEISVGSGKIFLIKSDIGFTVEVYNGDDLIDSIGIYDDEVQQEDLENKL